MADIAMAALPAATPNTRVGLSASSGQLEALKFAAQADAFQDDPNFYSWLDDWIGKQDEETAMIDAFNTLTDYGMQFEFQQQQQQLKPEIDAEQATGDAANQIQLSAPSMHGACGTSSCASLASHPSSQPSSDDPGHGGLTSPSDSFVNSSGAPFPAAALLPSPLGASPALPLEPAGGPGPVRNLRSGAGNGAASGGDPFDAASFMQPLSRGLDAFALPPELSRLLGRPLDGNAGSLLEPLSPEASLSLPADRAPSHGTVTSYAGTPPLPAAPPAPLAANVTEAPAEAGRGPAARPPATAPSGLGNAGYGTDGACSNGLQPPGLRGVPTLEQLIARAICGNGSDSGASAAGGGGGSLSSLGHALLGGVGASGFGGGHGAMGAGGGMGGSASAPSFLRNASSGSFGDGGRADSVACSMDEDSPSGSGPGCLSSLQDLMAYQNLPAHYQQQQQQPVRSFSGLSGGTSGGVGGGATTRLLGSRRKSSFHVVHPPTHGHGHAYNHQHHHHHGIPVSHAHGHAHVGKAVVGGTGGTGAGAYAGGGAHARGSGGVSVSGKPTRSARAKAVFAALEAEVAGKLSELEALQREHATLTQRVEILEVAVGRQDAVLSLMHNRSDSAATSLAATGASGTAATLGAPAAAPASAPVGAGPPAPAAAVAGRELLEWARACTLETYTAWYKEHLQNLSLSLLALEDSDPNPEAEARLVQSVTSGWSRNTLVCIFQPLIQLQLRGLNLETGCYAEPSEQHWMEVIKFMTVGQQQVAEMENLFHSYNLLHSSFQSELQDTQAELQQLVAAQDSLSRDHCSKIRLEAALQQTALLKRVRSILQRTHLLYSSTIGVAALRILKPKEFAKCQVQSYPHYPCGPSLMKACFQLRSMKAIWGGAAMGCDCDG